MTTTELLRGARPHLGLGASVRLGGASAGAALAADAAETVIAETGEGDLGRALDRLLRHELPRRPGAFGAPAPEVAAGAADLADWLVATGRLTADSGRELAILGRHGAAELAAAAELRRVVTETIDGIGAQPRGEQVDLGAQGGTVARVLPGTLWIEAPGEAEPIGPVRVPPAASAAARPGWRLAPLRLARSWTGEWLIAELDVVLPAWAD